MDLKTPTFALLLATTLAAGCVPGNSDREGSLQENFIIGGSPEGGYGAVVAVLYGGSQGCTGTLVNRQFVVTAAHCIDGESAGNMSIFFGNNVDATGTTIPVARATAHPNYNGSTLASDIAVLQLTAPAPSSVQPIPYSTTPLTDAHIGRQVTFVGFGIANVNQDSSSGLKRSVEIPITELSPTEIFYGAPGRQTCFGDSGGPALLTIDGVQRLIGVTSYGDEDCAEYGANTRTDAFAPFLADTIGDNSGTVVGSPSPTPDPATNPEADPEADPDPDTAPPTPGDDDPLEICIEEHCVELPRDQNDSIKPGDDEGPRFNVNSGCSALGAAPSDTSPTALVLLVSLGFLLLGRSR